MKLSTPAIGLAIAALVAGFVLPSATQAAAELSSSFPAPGAELSEPPDEIELLFTQDIEEATLAVNGSELEVEIDEEQVSAGVDSLAEGDYLVEWTVTSSVDGRETSGQFRFHLRPAQEDEAPPDVDPEARAERVEEVGDDNRTEVLLWTSIGIAAAGVLALVFFYFRTSIPTFGTTRIEGGLPPPGQSPPEHPEEDNDAHH